MRNYDRDQVLFLSSYPPRECGIATYSKDLINAVSSKFSPTFDVKVCALENNYSSLDYPSKVISTLNTRVRGDYLQMAGEINTDESIKMVFIQHEFGLFGGNYGNYLFDFLFALRKPVSVTFHSVLPQPDAELLRAVQTIAKLVDSIVVLTKKSADILSKTYGIDSRKICTIPHGTHLTEWKKKEGIKEEYGLTGKSVLSTFGLLSPNKSIETAIEAIPAIRQKVPDVLYLVLGKTHPGVVQNEGEKYRNYLKQRVADLQLDNHVKFVNKFLDLDDLLNYLRATDLYLFTSKDPYQAVSGTFAYAMSCGCPIISTPIPHALEMLENGGGCLVDFNNPTQLAGTAIDLLMDRDRLATLSHMGFQQSRASAWDNVAVSHARLFANHISDEKTLQYNYPEITLKHIYELTDSKGIIQFSSICEPDINSGYTLDDNARALIALCMYYSYSPKKKNRDLLGTYLRFIKHCQLKNGSFLNYVDKNGNHSEKNYYVNLEDSNGRAIWALGAVVANENSLPENYVKLAEEILLKCLPWTLDVRSPRAIAFVIKGLYNYNQVRQNLEISEIIDRLAKQLTAHYQDVRTRDWNWFETHLTYANAVMPEAMMRAYAETGNPDYRLVAEESIAFLISRITHRGIFRFVSNRGWLHKGKESQIFGEQPIEAAYTIFALEFFWRTTRDDYFQRLAFKAFDWFLGRNQLGQSLYNPVTGGCHDGLEEHEVNLNQGAESTLCYVMARLTMDEMIKSIPEKLDRRPYELSDRIRSKRKTNLEKKILRRYARKEEKFRKPDRKTTDDLNQTGV